MNEPNPGDVPGSDGAITASRDGNRNTPVTDENQPAGGTGNGSDRAAGSSKPSESSRPDTGADRKADQGPNSGSGANTGQGRNAGSGQNAGQDANSGSNSGPGSGSSGRKRRRRRGGRGRGGGGGGATGQSPGTSAASGGGGDADAKNPSELPNPSRRGRPSADDAAKSLVRTPSAESGPAGGDDKPRVGDSRPAPAKPRIGDTRPAPAPAADAGGNGASGGSDGGSGKKRRRRRGGRGRGSGRGHAKVGHGRAPEGVRSGVAKPVTALTGGEAVELDEETLEERRGKTRNGKPVGRYLMAVHKQDDATHIAILEGRTLIEHHVAHPTDDITQIHGNVYLGRVQNVLPSMEAAFIDIGTPKNAVLYRGDLHFDPEDIEQHDKDRIEQILQPRQTVLCQVTKNPIMHKGARLTQEVSLPGRFVVLVPNSRTVGISKRLPDSERKRLRKIIDKHRPKQHGVIVRTAAEEITAPEIERDLARLVAQWEKIEALAKKASAPALLYREPDMALRLIREEFNRDFRSVLIDDEEIFDDVHDYVASVSPALAERVEYFDPAKAKLPLLERHRVIEQLRRALDRKVWLPSGGSLIIEHTEALTVIDVNTGKNVGKSSLEETVFDNNLEAAVEIAHQLRLRDVGGIIVIDFVDMEVKKHRAEVVRVFRDALARDKTRTQVFDISELGLVQMTRKRIGEGLLESFSEPCAVCSARGVVFDETLFAD